MTDVVKIAKEHLSILETQIGKLEDFIQMADALVKHGLSNQSKVADANGEKPAASVKPGTLFTAKTETEDDAEAEPVRKLNTKERIFKSRSIRDEPEPERRYPSMGRLHP